jgi:thiamine pyrophosphate-dependent acetolactate synthase large subunit-like protein
LGLRYGVEDAIKSADVILVLDCDVPWINTQCHPNPDAKIYHVDVDPLKQQMPVFYLNALSRYRADSYNAVTQLQSYITSTEQLKAKVTGDDFSARWVKLQDSYKKRIETIASLAVPGEDGNYSTSYLMSRVRHFCPKDTIWAIEAVTQTAFVADQIQATLPGSWLNCGGGGLGWSGGGALGIKLATDKEGGKKFVCQIVGGMFVSILSPFWKIMINRVL